MMRSAFLLAVLVACGTSGNGGGGDGTGLDTLPKRGEMATDPTIVSASAHCGPEVSDGDPSLEMKYVTVQVAGSDPAGANGLGTCAATLDGISAQGTFGTSGSCYAEFMHACSASTKYVVDLTVSNKTGGVTTASVSVTTAP